MGAVGIGSSAATIDGGGVSRTISVISEFVATVAAVVLPACGSGRGIEFFEGVETAVSVSLNGPFSVAGFFDLVSSATG